MDTYIKLGLQRIDHLLENIVGKENHEDVIKKSIDRLYEHVVKIGHENFNTKFQEYVKKFEEDTTKMDIEVEEFCRHHDEFMNDVKSFYGTLNN